ncbi:MAG: sodium/proline symporter [Candidatus Rhabdochlamydia sp.]|jgi:sodium/proline symporter|nr:sodium/proline symporter [Chlamydiota bacterium]
MHTSELLAVISYFFLLTLIVICSYKRHLTATDFIIGSRSLNYWLTALAAHASDMSSWLFMGYPAMIFAAGLFNAWAAIGLILFMFLNWQFIAPKLRTATEEYNSLTLSSFFESRLTDTSGLIRIFTATMSIVFYTIYISAGLVGLGILLEVLFQVHYSWGVFIGISIIIPYVFIGGYLTLAWIDLFQGIFLMLVIVATPLLLLNKLGGWDHLFQVVHAKKLSLSLFPNFSFQSILKIIYMVFGWGLGYFGQPHIITKFMGIRDVKEMKKSQYIGMSWMILSISASTLVGLVGILYFQQGLEDPQQLFVLMVRDSFTPFFVGFILCGVLAATINAMSAQVLILSSNISEDFYKRLIRKTASSKERLVVARIGIILVGFLAFFIAYSKISSIYSLVMYAWSGLGCSFGPLILLCLYWKKVNKYGAWAGILTGGMTAAIWPYFNAKIPSMIPGFFVGLIAIYAVSKLTQNKIPPSTLQEI